MFKNGQVWKDNAGRLAFRIVFIQPVDWDEMHVQFFLNGRLVIETANGTFTVSGARVRR